MNQPAPAGRDYCRRIDSQLHLSSDTSSAGLARRFLARLIEDWSCPVDSDVALLLVSELVTNAVLYTRGETDLRVRWAKGVLRAEVHDESDMAPAPKNYGDDAATGRGLMLVETLALAWGSDPTPGGKVVWFELPAAHTPDSAVG